MICRVCKRELSSPVCGFCGEDNSSLWSSEQGYSIQERKAQSDEKDGALAGKRKRKKSGINYGRVVVAVLILALIVGAIWFVVSLFGKDDAPPPVETENLFSSGMLAVCTNGEWGFVNKENLDGYVVVPGYRKVTDFHGERAAARIGSKYCLIDKNGEYASSSDFDSVGEFSDNGYIAVESDGKWGYVDEDGDYVINPKFNTAYGFSKQGHAAVSINGSYGYIGKDGEYTIAPQYDMAFTFSDDGYAAVKIDGKYGYITTDGTAVIEPEFEYAASFSDGIACVKKNGDYGAIDTEGNFVIEPQFDDIFTFNPAGYAKVRIGRKYGYVDKQGVYKINPRFTDIGDFTAERLIFAQRSDGKYGFTDENGKFVIQPEYDGAGNFSCGLAPVKVGEVWGYIDTEGNTVIEPSFAQATEFYADGYAVVRNVDSTYLIIDTSGNTAFSGAGSDLEAVMFR